VEIHLLGSGNNNNNDNTSPIHHSGISISFALILSSGAPGRDGGGGGDIPRMIVYNITQY
jgi:hypothetical protein